MGKKRYYVGLIGNVADGWETVASCPTDEKTIAQMRRDGLSCHIIDCGRIEIAVMHNCEIFDEILVMMAINSFIMFTDNGFPMMEVELDENGQ